MRPTAVEVTRISSHGIWLLAHEQELFMPYRNFPWFSEVPVRQILNVQEPTPGHFYWPDRDVDLTAEIIEHPDRFPNKAKRRRPLTDYRIDQDLMGEVRLPAEAYYGAQTQRAVENSPNLGQTLPPERIHAIRDVEAGDPDG